MSKTTETKELENLLFEYNKFNGFFCIFECTIGFGGGGRVDCISIDTRGCIRAFEIKVTKSDFHSKHGHNFVGNLNYYVMTPQLYQEVKKEIPKDIGVMYPKNGQLCIIKSAKLSELKEPRYKIELYIIRSLFREYEKTIYTNNKDLLQSYENEKFKLKRERDYYYKLLSALNTNIREYLGNDYINFKNWLQKS